jgi:hypothetical protein
MKHLIAVTAVALALAGCTQTDSAPEPAISQTIAASDAPSPVESPTPQATTKSPSQEPTTPAPTPKATKPGTTSFCKYLKQTAGAQQQVEDPAQFVALVNGALAVAPGAIQEDLALYAESVQKLADTVTAGPKKAARADQWLSENEDAIDQAEANLNAYSESVCGQPFITGEGG